MKLHAIIREPILTEKTRQAEFGSVYTVLVATGSTKVEIGQAFETLYGVHVESVNTIKMRPKYKKSNTGDKIKRHLTTKALVTLRKGEKIEDFTQVVQPKK